VETLITAYQNPNKGELIMKKITLLFIGMLLLSAALFAGGEPRVLYVRLVNHDGTSLVNDPSVLDFTATLSGDTQNDTSPDFGYYFVGGNMYLKIQLANFAGVWAIGQTVYIDVTRTDPAGTGSCEVIIPEGFSTIWWGRPPSASGTVYPGEPITINPTGPPPVTYTLNIAIDDTVSPGGTYTINDQPYQAQLVDDNDEVNDLIGTYTISDAPEGYYWSVNPIVVSEADFDPDTNIANITFVLVEDTPPPAYTITITAADAETNEPLVANIYIDGVDSGYLTPYTFTEGVDYTPGVYTVVLDGYTDWIPESVTFPAVLTHDYTTNFIGTREQVTPVELSSFSATLTANLFVKLTWVSQTETNMVGYKVYRGTSANIADAEMLDIPMVPATNTSSSATYTVTDSNVLENNTYYYWLETIDYHETQFFGPTSVFVESVTPPVTNQTKIVKSGPNPFKIGDTYNIQLDVKTGETGTVTIYNVIGQVVRTYSVTGGSNQLVKWDGKDSRGNTCGSGIYFYKLSTPSVNQSKKIVVVK
jgi:hypothetical protein